MTEPNEPIQFPPDLKNYLPLHIWRALYDGEPRRGLVLDALDRLRNLAFYLSSHLPSHLVEEKERRPIAGLVRGQILDGTLLFADVSGFTAMSEKLAEHGERGAEILTDRINRYFEKMLDILMQSNGILLKFAGDALLVYFPAQQTGTHVGWAVRAAQRMMQAMSEFANLEPPLRMKISISSGEFLAASVGNPKRMEYVVLGGAVIKTYAGEALATAGEIVVDASTAAKLDPGMVQPHRENLYLVKPLADEKLDTFEIRAGKRRGRSTVPWSASTQELVIHFELALRQIKALTPYLDDYLVQSAIAYAGQRRMASEFRPAIVMFVNFIGVEKLVDAWRCPDDATQDQLAVQRITRVLNDYFNMAHSIVAKYGGIITRIDPYSQGSKMLVVFGAPVVHEEDPRRAVSVSLEMIAEIERLNEQWRKTMATNLPDANAPLVQLRMGITEGRAFAGQVGSTARREYTVMGDEVNLSARLMSAAQPSQVLLSQNIYDQVVDYFSADALPPIRVKGKSNPIPIYSVKSARDDALARRLRRSGTFVGRKQELEICRKLLYRAIATAGARITVQGVAGIGASNFADRLLSYALARAARVVVAECTSYSAEMAYAPWIQIISALAGITATDGAEIKSEKLLKLITNLGLDPNLHGMSLASLLSVKIMSNVAPRSRIVAMPTPATHSSSDLDSLLSTPIQRRARTSATLQRLQFELSDRDQARLTNAVYEVLTRYSADTPLVLYFENAHWMDASSRAWLDQFAKQVQNAHILMLVVQRIEHDTKSQEWSGDENDRLLTLQPLNPQDTGELFAKLMGQSVSSLSPELIARVHAQSGGNPLFIGEIARGLRQVAQDKPGEWMSQLDQGLFASRTVQELLLSRIDAMPFHYRDTLKAASVIGDEFSRDELKALIPTDEHDLMVDTLVDLFDARFILVSDESATRFQFQQSLTREVVYRSISFAQRRDFHAQIAEHWERQLGERKNDRAETLAHHYFLAEKWLPSTNYLLASGDKALKQFAYAQAKLFYQRALEALDHLSVEHTLSLKPQVLERLGDVALMLVGYPTAASHYDSAQMMLADASPARLFIKLALVLPTQSKPENAEKFAQRAWDVRKTPEDELMSAATRGWLLWRRGDATADEWRARAQSLLRSASDEWTIALDALFKGWASDWRNAQLTFESIEHGTGIAFAGCRWGDQLLPTDLQGASEVYERAASLCERGNDIVGLTVARYRQAMVAQQRSAAENALGILRQLASLLYNSDAVQANARAAIDAAIGMIERGELLTPWYLQSYDDSFCIGILFRYWERVVRANAVD